MRTTNDLYKEIAEWQNKAHEAFSYIRELQEEIKELKEQIE